MFYESCVEYVHEEDMGAEDIQSAVNRIYILQSKCAFDIARSFFV